MIKHLVMWKLKDSAEGADKEQNACKMKKDLEALKHKIPQIKHLEVGMNFMVSDAAYDLGLYAEFANEQDLDTYLKHPEHIKAAEFVAKVRSSRAVVDYKTE